jgi:hypothetical protein
MICDRIQDECSRLSTYEIEQYKHFLLMKIKKLALPENFIYLLVNLPESGYGYRKVNVFLKSGKVLQKHKVINSEFLILDQNEDISAKDIADIELETSH